MKRIIRTSLNKPPEDGTKLTIITNATSYYNNNRPSQINDKRELLVGVLIERAYRKIPEFYHYPINEVYIEEEDFTLLVLADWLEEQGEYTAADKIRRSYGKQI